MHFDTPSYEPSENVTTRATAQPQPEVQDLGDGWQAEVSLVPDTTRRPEQNVATRAIYGNKHYTIRAYQGSTLKGEIKGKFNGNNFTPDAGDPGVMQLPHGYYDFVCFNDKVTANGTTLSVNRADIPNAYYTVERNVLINQDPKQKVAFTSKHAGALVKVYLEFTNCYIGLNRTATAVYEFGSSQPKYKTTPKNPTDQFQYTISTNSNSIPENVIYDFAANTYSSPVMGQIQKTGGLETPNVGGYGYHNEMQQSLYSDYWLPNTDCSKVRLTFNSGSLYGKSLAGKTITVPTHKLVEANKYYTIVIRLIMENMYLYSDGTVGFLGNNAGKTAIGVVPNAGDSWAVALHDVSVSGNQYIQWSNTTSSESYYPVENYQMLFPYSVPYGKTTTNNIATQAAKNYTPQLSGKSWQVSTFIDFLTIGSDLGKMDSRGKNGQFPHDYKFLIPEGASATGFIHSVSSINFPQMDMTRFNAAFTRVNGDPIVGSYWTDTECKDGSEYKQVVVNVGGSQYSISLQPKNSTAKIRPIIWF